MDFIDEREQVTRRGNWSQRLQAVALQASTPAASSK